MYEEDEFDEWDDEFIYDTAVASFVRRMLLINVFSKLKNEFDKEQFKKAFNKTFKSVHLEDEDLEDAFGASLDLEIIEETSRGSKIYSFNGIALQSDEYH